MAYPTYPRKLKRNVDFLAPSLCAYIHLPSDPSADIKDKEFLKGLRKVLNFKVNLKVDNALFHFQIESSP